MNGWNVTKLKDMKNIWKISYAFQKNFFVGVYQQVVELDKALATFNSFSKRCVNAGWLAHMLQLEKTIRENV